MNVETEVKKAKKGNKASFERLIREHQQVMYRVAKTIVKKDEDCADVMQEAIYNAYRSISNLREPHYFKSWLIRIVINECYVLIRGREKIVPLKDWGAPAEDDSGYQAIEMQMVLNQLPKNDSEILNLYYINDISIKHISEILDIPENTVKTRIRRAKDKLSNLLNPANKEVSDNG